VTTSKVPILGDIPILGSIFRSSATQKRKSELIILVTPKILSDK
jgi:type IV pilus assembly protein PilQ